MALQDCNMFVFPRMPNYLNGAITLTQNTIDGPDEAFAVILRAVKAGSITKVGWRTGGTITTGSTLEIRLETISASTGLPTGTLWGTGTNATQVVTTSNTNTWFTSTLGSPATVAVGDLIGVVIKQPTADYGNCGIPYCNDENYVMIPYGGVYGTGWSKSMNILMTALEYSDGVYPYHAGIWPFLNTGTQSINSGSTADEWALKFTVPFKCRMAGAVMIGTLGGAVDVVLYDSSSTQLQSYSLNPIYRYASAGPHYCLFNTPQTLTPGSTYYLSLKPTSSTTISVAYLDVASAALANALPGGSTFQCSTRADGGAWTDNTLRRPQYYLLIDQLDDGASGGSGSYPVLNGAHIIR